MRKCSNCYYNLKAFADMERCTKCNKGYLWEELLICSQDNCGNFCKKDYRDSPPICPSCHDSLEKQATETGGVLDKDWKIIVSEETKIMRRKEQVMSSIICDIFGRHAALWHSEMVSDDSKREQSIIMANHLLQKIKEIYE